MIATPSRSPRVAVAQFHCAGSDVARNLETIGSLISQASSDGADLVVLHETATTGYFIADALDRLAETDDGPSATQIAEFARANAIHVAVGMAIRDGARFYDAQLLFAPDGTHLATYKKCHLFSSERQWYAQGEEAVVVETGIGRIGLSICYDLIFPEFIRKLADLGADLVINSTNWIGDDFQRQVWDWSGGTVTSLARTRALENGVWLAMANGIGPEQGFQSLGHSCVVAPSGKVLASVGEAQGFAAADLDYDSDELERWRAIATYRSDRRPQLY
ncbi:carbon-nitrogen hydrolase family protein [Pseudohoeflea coraliihabitans]|uniref:Carbon-nitrogen hydrolase family protein n=1 Tax=Pseudohoeflea coraliihabitans TaxID=2860393 RepID=A0ABS6WV86_9HYPH|nr:carbon-nitrogen hydrolase family protein [Pseudohoeflea sp. DP4N28-3]MBW3098985.1 carbon-nitrogen hydrolase family protein [Pseudohoeflea sp. DP4N28-3]